MISCEIVWSDLGNPSSTFFSSVAAAGPTSVRLNAGLVHPSITCQISYQDQQVLVLDQYLRQILVISGEAWREMEDGTSILVTSFRKET